MQKNLGSRKNGVLYEILLLSHCHNSMQFKIEEASGMNFSSVFPRGFSSESNYIKVVIKFVSAIYSSYPKLMLAVRSNCVHVMHRRTGVCSELCSSLTT